jgi:hypothetical protein
MAPGAVDLNTDKLQGTAVSVGRVFDIEGVCLDHILAMLSIGVHIYSKGSEVSCLESNKGALLLHWVSRNRQ